MASLFELLGTVKWDDLEGYETNDSSLFEYSNAKIMTIMMGRELNKRLKVITMIMRGSFGFQKLRERLWSYSSCGMVTLNLCFVHHMPQYPANCYKWKFSCQHIPQGSMNSFAAVDVLCNGIADNEWCRW